MPSGRWHPCIKSVHNNEKPHQCEHQTCGAKFARKRELLGHYTLPPNLDFSVKILPIFVVGAKIHSLPRLDCTWNFGEIRRGPCEIFTKMWVTLKISIFLKIIIPQHSCFSCRVIRSHWGLKWKVDPKYHTFLECLWLMVSGHWGLKWKVDPKLHTWLLNNTPTQLFRGGVRLYIHLSNPKSGCSSAQIFGAQANWGCSSAEIFGEQHSYSTQFRFQISDVRCQISDFRIQITDFRFQISDFWFQISDVWFMISDFL